MVIVVYAKVKRRTCLGKKYYKKHWIMISKSREFFNEQFGLDKDNKE